MGVPHLAFFYTALPRFHIDTRDLGQKSIMEDLVERWQRLSDTDFGSRNEQVLGTRHSKNAGQTPWTGINLALSLTNKFSIWFSAATSFSNPTLFSSARVLLVSYKHTKSTEGLSWNELRERQHYSTNPPRFFAQRPAFSREYKPFNQPS